MNTVVFEDIKHIDEDSNEYWYARELMIVLEYSLWQNFNKVIKSAIQSCINSHNNVNDHFIEVNKMIEIATDLIENKVVHLPYKLLI